MAGPYIKFYTDAWLGDTGLQLSHPSTIGGWINLLCYLHDSPDRGRITARISKIQALMKLNGKECDLFVEEALANDFCNWIDHNDSDIGDPTITVENRRMIREESSLKSGRERQKRYRESQNNDGEDDGDKTAKSEPPITKAITKESTPKAIEEEEEHESGDIVISDGFIISRKKKKLMGWRLDVFIVIWHLYEHKENRAEAADAILELEFPTDESEKWDFIARLVLGAKRDTDTRWERDERGTPVKAFQGWISGRRWENYDEWIDQHLKSLTLKRFKVKFDATLAIARKTTRLNK